MLPCTSTVCNYTCGCEGLILELIFLDRSHNNLNKLHFDDALRSFPNTTVRHFKRIVCTTHSGQTEKKITAQRQKKNRLSWHVINHRKHSAPSYDFFSDYVTAMFQHTSPFLFVPSLSSLLLERHIKMQLWCLKKVRSFFISSGTRHKRRFFNSHPSQAKISSMFHETFLFTL